MHAPFVLLLSAIYMTLVHSGTAEKKRRGARRHMLPSDMASPPQTKAEVQMFMELKETYRAQDGGPHYAKMVSEHNLRYAQQVNSKICTKQCSQTQIPFTHSISVALSCRYDL